MSNKESLTAAYERFFKARRPFIVSPYTSILRSSINDELAQRPKDEAPMAGIFGSVRGTIICVALTILPVLPTMVVAAFALAAIATLLAYASMAITYPVAEAIDYCARPSMGMK